MQQWSQFLSALVLAFLRVSGMVVFAPFFSSRSLPTVTKAVFAVAVAYLLAPLVAALPHAEAVLSFGSILGELAVGLVYGITLALLTEMLLFAGQIIGVQFSFSLVNLLDPTSQIETPLMGELLQLMGTLVVLTAGLDRILLDSVIRSFRVVPLGMFAMNRATPQLVVEAMAGVFLAALELAAPVLAATMLVEIAISLVSKLSPQLPVMSLSVPMKTMTGFALMAGSLALWPRFIEARFDGLLNFAERLLAASVMGHAGGG